jgi:hypothetical protein
MKDRKPYWREYQRRRRMLGCAIPAGEKRPRDFDHAAFKALLQAEYASRGLTSHKHWRAKASLKRELLRKASPDAYGGDYFRRALCARSQSRAKAAGIPFNLTPKDIPLPTHCCVLGLELDYNLMGVRVAPEAPSVDRIDNTRGYEPDNIQVISHRANKLKGDATLDELIAIGNWASHRRLKI